MKNVYFVITVVMALLLSACAATLNLHRLSAYQTA